MLWDILIFFSVFKCIFILTVPPPTITQHPKSQTVDLHSNFSNLTLICKGFGYQLAYTWTVDDAPITASSHYITDNSNLHIFYLKPSDGGQYRCTVSNPYGSANSNYSILHIVGEWLCCNYHTTYCIWLGSKKMACSKILLLKLSFNL